VRADEPRAPGDDDRSRTRVAQRRARVVTARW
jgi:hypothetical protein